MPWASTTRPSLALGILTSICNEFKIKTNSFYPNLDMAALLGFEVSDNFSEKRILHGLSEHLFAVDLYNVNDLNSDEYLKIFVKLLNELYTNDVISTEMDLKYLKNLRDNLIPKFLNNLLKRILKKSPNFVGFTTTFNQIMSSLALSKRIKNADPNIKVFFGGANFHYPMGYEYHKALPDLIDHVFIGEAEESFRNFLYCLKNEDSYRNIKNFTYLENGNIKLVKNKKLTDLNESPLPNYDDFFYEKERILEQTNLTFNLSAIPFESSRGCWWGQKSHCSFCGNSKEQINYREKKIEKIIHEILFLSNRYKEIRMSATDWILTKKNYDRLLNRLKEINLDLEIFYEVRPYHKKEEIKLMKEANIISIQPGIESFSTPVLKLMNKHLSGIRNIEFLKWCKEYGIETRYNILSGFPGEKLEWYNEMIEMIPKIYHIPPPLSIDTRIELHRFSPLYETKETKIKNFKLRSDYECNFPINKLDQEKVGYFFEHQSESPIINNDEYYNMLGLTLEKWIKTYEKRNTSFNYNIGPGFLKITDNRQKIPKIYKLSDIYKDILLLCDEVKNINLLIKDLMQIYPKEIEDGTAELAINELINSNILIKEKNNLLSLPINVKPRTTSELYDIVFN